MQRLRNVVLKKSGNNSNAKLQPYKNLAIHTKRPPKQPHEAPTKKLVVVVVQRPVQVVVLLNLPRHRLLPKPPRAAAKLRFHINTNNTNCLQLSIYYNLTKSRDTT